MEDVAVKGLKETIVFGGVLSGGSEEAVGERLESGAIRTGRGGFGNGRERLVLERDVNHRLLELAKILERHMALVGL